MAQDKKYWPPREYPSPINWQELARNNISVPHELIQRVSAAQNHTLAYRKKMIFCQSMEINTMPNASNSAVEDMWHFMFHTGHGTDEVVFLVGMAPSNNTGANNRHVYVELTPTGGGAADSEKLYIQQADGTPSDVPNNFHWGEIRASVSANQEYQCVFKRGPYARPFALMGYEIGQTPVLTSGAGGVHQGFGQESRIIDDDFEQIMNAQRDTWLRNGSHFISIVPPHDGTSWPESGTPTIPFDIPAASSAIDLFGEGSGTVSVFYPYIDNEARRYSDTSLALKMGVYGVASGTDAGNTVDGYGMSVNITTTKGWHTGTADYNGSELVQITASTAATHTMDIMSVCIWAIDS